MKTIVATVQKHGKMGFGFSFRKKDRLECFDSSMPVRIELQCDDGSCIKFEKRFNTCGELIKKEICLWLEEQGLIPWPKGFPPKFEAELVGKQHIVVGKRIQGGNK